LQLFEPRLNKQGPRWKNGKQDERGAEEFLQYVPWEFGEEQKPIGFETQLINSKIDGLSERIDKLNGK